MDSSIPPLSPGGTQLQGLTVAPQRRLGRQRQEPSRPHLAVGHWLQGDDLAPACSQPQRSRARSVPVSAARWRRQLGCERQRCRSCSRCELRRRRAAPPHGRRHATRPACSQYRCARARALCAHRRRSMEASSGIDAQLQPSSRSAAPRCCRRRLRRWAPSATRCCQCAAALCRTTRCRAAT